MLHLKNMEDRIVRGFASRWYFPSAIVSSVGFFFVACLEMAKVFRTRDLYYPIVAVGYGLMGLVWAIMARRAYRFRSQSRRR